MQASKRLVPLNARIDATVRRGFDVAVAHRGITKQEAVEEALRRWVADQAASRKRRMDEAPLIPSRRPGSLRLTNKQIDDLLFG